MPKHGPAGDVHGIKSGKRSSGGRAAAKSAAKFRLAQRGTPRVGVGTPQGTPANLASPQVPDQNFIQFLQQLFGGGTSNQPNAAPNRSLPPGVGFGLGALANRAGPNENDPLGIGSVGAGDLANLFTTMGILRNQNVNTTAQAFDQDPLNTVKVMGQEFMRALLNEGQAAFSDIKFPLGGPR